MLIVFIGDAEGLGPLVFHPRQGGAYGEDVIGDWEKLDAKNDFAYLEHVRAQQALLEARVSAADPACSAPEITKRMATKGALGSVTFVSLVDGPNVDDRGRAVAQDSDFKVRQYGFEQVGDDVVWAEKRMDVPALAALSSGEVLVPDALDAIVAHVPELARLFAKALAIDVALKQPRMPYRADAADIVVDEDAFLRTECQLDLARFKDAKFLWLSLGTVFGGTRMRPLSPWWTTTSSCLSHGS